MNLLSMVMGLLLIFACTFSLTLRKENTAQRIEKTYQSHMNASRRILSTYESLCYENLRGEKNEKQPKTKKETPKEKKIETINHECARINLFPLIADGKEKHPILYETAAQVLRNFYMLPLFDGQKRFEYQMLDAIIESAQQNKDTSLLEKLALKDSCVKPLYTMQSIYYRMLRGTKHMPGDPGFPSLLECFTIEKQKMPICLRHASLEMLSALFGPRAAAIIAHERADSETPLTYQRIQDICAQNGQIGVSEDFLKLFDMQSCRHFHSGEKTLVQQDADVCLKQKVFLPS